MADPVIPLFTFDTPVSDSNLESLVLRQNFNAIARSNWTTDASYPQNPRNGMVRVLDENGLGTNIQLQMYIDAWVTIIHHLETLVSLARRLEFTITVAAAGWQIDHNLGVKPLVQVLDAADFQLTPTSVQHVQTGVPLAWNRIIITHGAPVAGYAIVVG